MPHPDPREAVERAARELLHSLAGLPAAPSVLVTEAEGRLTCLIRVAPVRARRRREECRRDVVAALRAADRPLTRPQVVKALAAEGKPHGYAAVAKALAELTAAGELVNPLDRRGYRLPEWDRVHPNLFSGKPR